MTKFVKNMSKMEFFRYILLFLYFLSISAFRLGTGFDAMFVRVIFVLMVFFSLINIKKIVVSKALLWAIIFWGFYFLSSVWAMDASDTLDKVPIAIQVIGLFFFLPTYVKDKRSLEIVLKILLLSLACSAAILLLKTPFSDFGIERLGKVIGLNPNAFGLRMSIGAIISLYLFHASDKRNKFVRLLYGIGVIVFVLFALLSGSKKALLIVVAGIPIYEILLAKGMNAVLKIIGVIISIGLVFALIFNNQQLYGIIGNRLERTFYTLTDQNNTRSYTDSSLLERQFYMDEAVKLFEKRPLLGYGGNNFVTHMRMINYSHISYSHNNYTELLATLGIIGFLIYYGFWFAVAFRLIAKYISERKFGKRLSVIMLFGIMMAMLFILDYGMVSYDSEFNMVIFSLAYTCYWLFVANNKKRSCLNG